jgi:succinate dehydrogenase/fumarate reductase flavoprotein subunit
MTDLLTTDVLVIGEGSAGQTAALAASEEGGRHLAWRWPPAKYCRFHRLSHLCSARWL